MVSWESENSGQMTNQILENESRQENYLTGDWRQLMSNSMIFISRLMNQVIDGVINGWTPKCLVYPFYSPPVSIDFIGIGA